MGLSFADRCAMGVSYSPKDFQKNKESYDKIVKSMPDFLAKLDNPSISLESIEIFWMDSSISVPPFPGATKISDTKLLLEIFHASACSLPPLPTTRTFMVFSNA